MGDYGDAGVDDGPFRRHQADIHYNSYQFPWFSSISIDL